MDRFSRPGACSLADEDEKAQHDPTACLEAAPVLRRVRPHLLHCLRLARRWRHLLRGGRLQPRPPRAPFALCSQPDRAPCKGQRPKLELICIRTKQSCIFDKFCQGCQSYAHMCVALLRLHRSILTEAAVSHAPVPPSWMAGRLMTEVLVRWSSAQHQPAHMLPELLTMAYGNVAYSNARR
jgi:hypothetical protein